jgi:hypothetical protein
MDALSLYETLEDQIVPITIPIVRKRRSTIWMRWVKEAIRTLSHSFRHVEWSEIMFAKCYSRDKRSWE